MNSETLHQLREKGFRLTPQRLAILNILQNSGRHMLPVEIVEEAQEKLPGITEATVYRTLEFLTNADLILPAHIGNGQLVYECAEHLHHHLICRVCSGSVDIDHSILQPLYDQLKESSGFLIDSVHVTLFGICPDCQRIKLGG